MAKSGLKFGSKSGTGYTRSAFPMHSGTTSHSALKHETDDPLVAGHPEHHKKGGEWDIDWMSKKVESKKGKEKETLTDVSGDVTTIDQIKASNEMQKALITQKKQSNEMQTLVDEEIASKKEQALKAEEEAYAKSPKGKLEAAKTARKKKRKDIALGIAYGIDTFATHRYDPSAKFQTFEQFKAGFDPNDPDKKLSDWTDFQSKNISVEDKSRYKKPMSYRDFKSIYSSQFGTSRKGKQMMRKAWGKHKEGKTTDYTDYSTWSDEDLMKRRKDPTYTPGKKDE